MRNPLRSLAARITLLVFLATIVSSLTVTWISVQSLDGFLRQKVDQRFPHVAQRISAELEQWYAMRTRELEVFATSAILTEVAPRLVASGRDGDRAREDARSYLQYVLTSFPQFERLMLATPDGEPLVGVGDGAPMPKGILNGLLVDASASRVSDAIRVEGDLVQAASVTLRDPSGRPLARLLATLDIERLRPILRSDELGDTASIFLVDRERRFLDPPPGIDPEKRLTMDVDDTLGESAVAYYEDARGLRVIGTRLPFTRFGWTIVIEQPYEEAFAPIVRSMRSVAGLNLVIVLVVGLIASRIAGSIVKPLRALSDAARRLSQGEREVSIRETSFASEEVNLLTRTFNEMSRGLGRSARELEANQQKLEAANTELVDKNHELSNMNLVLEQLSITDGLTKLHNHRYFQEMLTQECKRSARAGDPLCLVLIDIDFFKRWNDRLGHAGGDQLLRHVAEVLNECVRETDVLARYGGEEFALLAIGTDLEGATALGEKIRQSVEQTDFLTDVPSEREQMTVSVGISLFAGNRRTFFADADEALYTAKDTGRNRVVVAPVREAGERTDDDAQEAAALEEDAAAETPEA
jgi:diguanylate cyclase (GGDEF)-like protein